MQTSKILVVTLFAGLVGLVGCASQAKTGTTTMTAADVESTKSSSEAAPSSREASSSSHEASSGKREELPGQLVCKTSNRDTGATELRLEWNGNEATGTIRTIAPSGETTVQRVKAERYRGMIVVDEPGQEDLVVHAAVVAPSNGKQAMRVGSGMYTTCE